MSDERSAMTADDLRELKNKTPFSPFTIHMNGGKSIKVDDPEDLVIPRGWRTDAIVTHPSGRFAFVYIRNVSHISGLGAWPSGRRKRGEKNGE
jgi:hypothetical protein